MFEFDVLALTALLDADCLAAQLPIWRHALECVVEALPYGALAFFDVRAVAAAIKQGAKYGNSLAKAAAHVALALKDLL